MRGLSIHAKPLQCHVYELKTLSIRSPCPLLLTASVLRSAHCRGVAGPLSLRLAPPRARLSLISRHLENRPPLPLNTPFSSERQAEPHDDVDYQPIQRKPIEPEEAEKKVKMSQQAEHPALLIPGPIEFDDAVLQSMGHFGYAAFPFL